MGSIFPPTHRYSTPNGLRGSSTIVCQNVLIVETLVFIDVVILISYYKNDFALKKFLMAYH